GIGDADARSLLDGLVSKQFLAVDTDPRSVPRGTYEFVHIQVLRVALGTLSRRERKTRHLAAVEYLSQAAADPDLAAVLAEHLMAAFDAQPDASDALSIRRRALGLTLEAAARADSVGALSEAIALFARAAQIETDELLRAGYLVRAARCAERSGDHEDMASGYYAAAREIHERAGNERDALRLRARELYVYRWRRPSSELVGPLREIYDALCGVRDAAFADAAASLAGALYHDGEAESAEEVAAEAAAAAEETGAYEPLGWALSYRATALIELARPVEALDWFKAALATRQRHAPAEVPGTVGNIAVTLAALGRFEEAVAAGKEAMAAAERVASRVTRVLAALQLARVLFSLGQWDEALATVDEVADQAAPIDHGMVLGPRLLVAVYRGERERARTMIDEFDRSQARSGAAFESDYRSLREVVLAHLANDPVEAREVVARAGSGDYAEWPTWLALAVDLLARLPGEEPLLDALGALREPVVPKTSPMVASQLERLAALVDVRSGDGVRAAAHWSAAIEAAEGSGMVFNAAMLRLERAEHVPRHPRSLVELQGAIQTFDRLKATPFLERARRAAGGAEAVARSTAPLRAGR
ncbi:MAG: tetratricopeptide repeat protein, partial [Solirubrobacterales bacterium]|nr:tetratricopeptide repeat protein [Solirubrobacterales bacterium]